MDNFMMSHKDSMNVLEFFFPEIAKNAPQVADGWLYHYIGIGETIERIGDNFPIRFKDDDNLATVALFRYFQFARNGMSHLSVLMKNAGICDGSWSGIGNIINVYAELEKFYIYANGVKGEKRKDMKNVVRGMIKWLEEQIRDACFTDIEEKRLYRGFVVRFCIDFPIEFDGVKMTY